MDKPTLNSPAPDFTLKDANGDDWRLSDQRGKVVVLLFYPGDETPICTRQMCSVRDRWDDYVATGAEVVGISSDSIESHRKFAEHHNLPLRLLVGFGRHCFEALRREVFDSREGCALGFCDRCAGNSAPQRRAPAGLIQAEG